LPKFLDLWKDADPGIDEVEVARESSTRLKILLQILVLSWINSHSVCKHREKVVKIWSNRLNKKVISY
jgi:hypothetical protein